MNNKKYWSFGTGKKSGYPEREVLFNNEIYIYWRNAARETGIPNSTFFRISKKSKHTVIDGAIYIADSEVSQINKSRKEKLERRVEIIEYEIGSSIQWYNQISQIKSGKIIAIIKKGDSLDMILNHLSIEKNGSIWNFRKDITNKSDRYLIDNGIDYNIVECARARRKITLDGRQTR